MAEESRGTGADVAHTHVGHFLIGEGLSRLEAEAAYRPRSRTRATVIERHATVAYLEL